MSKVICNKADPLVCPGCLHAIPHERQQQGMHLCTEWAECWIKGTSCASVRCVKVKSNNPQGGEVSKKCDKCGEHIIRISFGKELHMIDMGVSDGCEMEADDDR